MVVILTGMLASGKSTLADNLGKQYQFSVYKKDTYKEHLVDIYDFKTREENRALSIKAVEQMLEEATNAIKENKDVVLEANFRNGEIKQMFDIAQKYHVKAYLFGLYGDKEVLYQRFMGRVPTRHKAHLSIGLDRDFDAYKKYNDDLMKEIGDFPNIKIDVTNVDADVLLVKVAKILNKEK